MAFNETIPYTKIKEIKEYKPESTPSFSYSENNNNGKEIIYCSNLETLPMLCDLDQENLQDNHKSKLSTHSKSILTNPNLVINNKNQNLKNISNIGITSEKNLQNSKINNLFNSIQINNINQINYNNNIVINNNDINARVLLKGKNFSSMDDKNSKINHDIILGKNTEKINQLIFKRKIEKKNIVKKGKRNLKNEKKSKSLQKTYNNKYHKNEYKSNIKVYYPKNKKENNYYRYNKYDKKYNYNNEKKESNYKKMINYYIENIKPKNNKIKKADNKNKSRNLFNKNNKIENNLIHCYSIKLNKSIKKVYNLSKSKEKKIKNNKSLFKYNSNIINKYNNNILKDKKKNKSLKLTNLQKIMKKNSLFNLLTFLDYHDILNILRIRNKKLRLLINKSISGAYYFQIKENLKKYKEYLEPIKYTLLYSKIKESLKIDLVISIRFIDLNNKITILNPRFFQLIYLYQYLKQDKNNKNLLYDYYQFDLFNEKNKNKNEKNKEFKGIYLSQEASLFGLDQNDELINMQPILPFKIKDKGIFNFEIYSSNNYFIEPSSIKIKLKSIDLNKNIKYFENNNIDSLRISEYEDICKHWKKVDEKYKYIKNLENVKNIFGTYFIINNIYRDNFGLSIYKFNLTAKKYGLLINNNINIKICIKDSNDFIENEIKKNNLLFERRNIFEIRVGESIIFYLVMKESKSPNKKKENKK